MPEAPPARSGGDAGGTSEALRAAVERTLAATAGSASGAGQWARELLDEVARRRGEVARRGEAAKDEVVRRGEEAREELARRGEEAGGRLAAAISELRGADPDELARINDEIAAIEGRLGELERTLAGPGGSEPGDRRPRMGEANPQAEGEISSSESDSSADSSA